jgi:hypothetical protein
MNKISLFCLLWFKGKELQKFIELFAVEKFEILKNSFQFNDNVITISQDKDDDDDEKSFAK